MTEEAPDTEPALAEEAVESVEPVAETAAEPVPEAKRGRGRPKGALNRVKIVVEPVPVVEPVEEPQPEPTPEPIPASVEPATPDPPKVRARGKATAKAAVEPVMAPESPHETLKAAMAAWKQVALLNQQAKSIHFAKLVHDMFT